VGTIWKAKVEKAEIRTGAALVGLMAFHADKMLRVKLAGKEGRTHQAATMLGAVTVVEGLLPILPSAAILAQLVGPKQHLGITAPTVPVQLLLAPDVHRHATPQLLNRVANLLVQVHITTAPPVLLSKKCSKEGIVKHELYICLPKRLHCRVYYLFRYL
jgi:hypothetical protein